MKLRLAAGLTIVAFLAGATPVLACLCLSVRSFDAVAADASLVVIGRVLSIGVTGSNVRDPSVIRMRAEVVMKGELKSEEFSVWNPMAGGSCGGALLDIKVGTQVAVALSPYGEASDFIKKRVWDLMAQMGRNLSEEDWLLTSPACATSIKLAPM